MNNYEKTKEPIENTQKSKKNIFTTHEIQLAISNCLRYYNFKKENKSPSWHIIKEIKINT